MSKYLSVLRQKTHDVHQSLENCYPFNQLLAEQVTDMVYLHVLQIQYDFQQWLHPQFLRNFDETFLAAFNYASFSRELKQDIQLLNGHFSNRNIARNLDKHTLLGCLYVDVGSSLGAKVIYRHIKNHTDLPNAFYRKAAESSLQWRAFQIAFEDYCDKQNANIDVVVAGAMDAFLTLKQSAAMYAEDVDTSRISSFH